MSAQFKIYLGAMEKMQTAVATQVDVLGAPEGAGAGAGMLSLFNKSTARITTVQISVRHNKGPAYVAFPIPCWTAIRV
jgi:hypothetical protein